MGSWKSVPGDDVGVWGFDGHKFEPLVSDRRGEPRKRAGEPVEFKEVCEYIVNMPDNNAVRAIVFPVGPKE